MNPAELLGHARDMLSRTDEETLGLWPRSVALLARQSLEAGVADTLARRAPGTEETSARAQLLCLPTFAPTLAAHEAGFLWFALTRACHHHPYELAATDAELRDWLDEVEGVLERISVERDS